MTKEKKAKLRHVEYFSLQPTLDELYSRSQNGNNFYNLIELMKSEENIRLAYRNIKKNKGSMTAGTDGQTITDIKNLSVEEVVSQVQSMFEWYKPQSVRRVFIPKPNGDKRPLGIPTIWDRIFQQCILQILEPICEAKFHKHNYGFRPNRSTHDAIARMNTLINKGNKYYCVDIDIKGFFDNVNHEKLLKQIWTLGIKDKALISIISRLLKAEIEGEGKPTKGTPQGGILSPLLSNIVLNEFDWWISNQWETFKTKFSYQTDKNKFAPLKKTRLKECFIVRYADDFKILCRDYHTAKKVFHATKDFLQVRLRLEINPQKSKVINLKKQGSDFLGIKIKAVAKKKKYVAQSKMTEKAKKNAKAKIKTEIKKIQKDPTAESVWNFNSVVMGIHKYYSVASQITTDLVEINQSLRTVLYNRLRENWTEASTADMTRTLKKRYGKYNPKLWKIQRMVLVPIYAQKNIPAMNFSQNTSNYTIKGREKIHSGLKCVNQRALHLLMKSFIKEASIEYNDNRISKYVAQYGKCAISGLELEIAEIHCHHVTPKEFGGTDEYSNLVIVHKDIHKLIHMKDREKIKGLLKTLSLNDKQILKFNNLRLKAHREAI
ncbi:group II intron reverse transcriptase/maturase [Planococcus lenghuensis]|uniref:Group II intron reverse transcriptase/maturase n=1 Tax=Planococcus lenghuensis TaxID=2213202 RepID=A0A1Q2L4N3_9BACL|nr:group II intron reverse transcriptase/maturase [Planococcus lenghuensis]AQQ55334.1 group II intron reverse transcriptase/maturase [Planococcus lenghuensis]